ncbi:hypothetical protein D9M72_547470 [compost metagenome]
MANRNEMALSHKDAGFAVGNLVTLKMGRLGDNEQLVSVDVHLRHLIAVEGVLNRQRMKAEHRLKARHLVRGGIRQSDPGKLAV